MSITYDDEPIGQRRVLIHRTNDESEEAVVIADFGNGMIKARTSDGDIWIGNRWEDLSGPFAIIRHGVKYLQRVRTSESASCAQQPSISRQTRSQDMGNNYLERLKSREPKELEQVLILLRFSRDKIGGYQRNWGILEVSCAEWLGNWYFICAWTKPREMGIPEFQVRSPISPAGLLARLYSECGNAFRGSPTGLPAEFVIGKEELDYERRTKALTPRPPTVWADREFLRFCLNYIDRDMDWLTEDYTITLSASSGQLRIESSKKATSTVYCPARGEWLGASEISASDLFRRLPKRFTGSVISLQQHGGKLIIGSQVVPSRFVGKD